MTAERPFSGEVRLVAHGITAFTALSAVLSLLGGSSWDFTARLGAAAGVGYGLSYAVRWLGSHIDGRAILQSVR